MSGRDPVSILNEAELAGGTALEFEGLPVWPLVRTYVGNRLARSKTTSAAASTSRLATLKRRLNTAFAPSLLERADVAFLTRTIDLRFRIEDRAFNVFHDALGPNYAELNLTAQAIEDLRSNDPRTPHASATHLLGLAYSRARGDRVEARTSSLRGEIERLFRPLIGEEAVPAAKSASVACGNLEAKAQHCGALLDRIEPRLGLISCYYGLTAFAFTLACRRRGVPSVDVQHGVQGRTHPAYGPWLDLPTNGFALLPDAFWTWTEVDAELCASWSNGTITAVCGGNPIEEFLHGESPALAKLERDLDRWLGPAEDVALVTLQTGYGLSPELRHVIAKTSDRCTWVVRVHPNEAHLVDRYRDELREISPTAKLDDGTRFPLQTILKRSQVHLTLYSSVVIEAERCGVPSVTIGERGRVYYGDQEDRGVLAVAQDSEDAVVQVLRMARVEVPASEPRSQATDALRQLLKLRARAV